MACRNNIDNTYRSENALRDLQIALKAAALDAKRIRESFERR